MKRVLVVVSCILCSCGQREIIRGIQENQVVQNYLKEHPHRGAVPFEIIELSGMRLSPKGAQGPVLTKNALPADMRMAADDWQEFFQEKCDRQIPNSDGYYFAGVFANETSDGDLNGTWPAQGGHLKMIFTRTSPPILLCAIVTSQIGVDCKCPGL